MAQSPKEFTKKGFGNTIRAKATKTGGRAAAQEAAKKQTVLVPASSPRSTDPSRKSVPRHTESQKLAPRSTKDFVSTNNKDAFTSPTQRRGQSAYLDKSGGTGQGRYTKKTSGYVPVFTAKPDYGKTPEYLTKRKEELTQEQNARDEMAMSQVAESPLQQMLDEERQQILEGCATFF